MTPTEEGPMTTTALIFLDTETTGLRPDIHVPWEIAWLAALHDHEAAEIAVYRSFRCFRALNDDEIRASDEAALKIGGFEARYDQKAALTDVQIAAQLANTCGWLTGWVHGDHLVHLVGAVPSFDHAMLCQHILGWPGFGEGHWHYHLLDVEALAAGRLGLPPPYSSQDLCARLDVPIDEANKHTAYGDALWALHLYAAVFDAKIIIK